MELARVLKLSFPLAVAQFKLKNEGSYLGIIWYLLNPLLLFMLLILVFGDRLGTGIQDYPLYLLIGIIAFNFFQRTTTEATRIVHENAHLIKSINFPRAALAGSIILKTLFQHMFEVIVLGALMLYFGVPVFRLLFYLPVLLVLIAFSFGVCLCFSAIAVYFPDLENIWLFASRLLWFATPIFYDIGGQGRLFFLNLFNPLYYMIRASRELIIYGTRPSSWVLAGALVYALAGIVIGTSIFNLLKRKLAELI